MLLLYGSGKFGLDYRISKSKDAEDAIATNVREIKSRVCTRASICWYNLS